LRGVVPRFVTLKGSDGVSIPACHWGASVTTNQKPAVLIVVHGGPQLQALPTWDSFTQSLVSRGCDVLAVNYRGSSGYGRQFEEMGDSTTRAGDVATACDYAVKELNVSAGRVFLYGESYGASLVLAAAGRIGEIGGLALVAWGGVDGDVGQLGHPRVVAYHGGMDPLAPAKSVEEAFRKRFGATVAGQPDNRWHVFPDEGHHFFSSASWAKVSADLLNLMELK
jgi:dienelactone hydrolase